MEKLLKPIMFILGAFFVISIITQVSINKIEYFKHTKVNVSSMTSLERERQLDCLSKNIYYEAGSEPFEGKVAVAQVTINRAESGQFPKDICQVVYQKNVVYERVLCQFSWYCETATMMRPKNTAVFKESEMVARQVLLEGFRLPSLKNALYFHATHINPKWNKEKVAIIAGHVFYK